jgi:hypothetical protein
MAESAQAREWLDRLDAEQRSQAEWLADAVGKAVPDVESAVKWRRLTFTVDGDYHHWLCAVAASKAGVRLVFHKGALLDDPDGLLAGDGKYSREASYEDASENHDSLTTLLRQAADKRTEML